MTNLGATFRQVEPSQGVTHFRVIPTHIDTFQGATGTQISHLFWSLMEQVGHQTSLLVKWRLTVPVALTGVSTNLSSKVAILSLIDILISSLYWCIKKTKHGFEQMESSHSTKTLVSYWSWCCVKVSSPPEEEKVLDTTPESTTTPSSRIHLTCCHFNQKNISKH